MRSTVERRDDIIQILYDLGRVRVDELSEQFSVTTVTIRNDLDFLEKKGILHRTHGGAIIRKNVYEDPTLEEKQELNKEEKQRIGQKAVEMIEEGDSILLDSGTTTREIARRINDIDNLTIMTNAINIAIELASKKNLNLMLTGGSIRSESYSLVGPDAESVINNYYFDKFFLGVDGLDLEHGLTTPNPMEAQLNRLMVKRAHEIIAVTDSSKFGRYSFSFICGIESISTIITDTKISTEFEKSLQRKDIEVIKV